MDIIYSIIIPTYRRPDVLRMCIDHVAAIEYDHSKYEVRVYDNGAPECSSFVVGAFAGTINIEYIQNEAGHGFGYSVRRGVAECHGKRIIELNDDALVPVDLLLRLDETFRSDPHIGVVGLRAIEGQAERSGTGIGRIDFATGEVVGNFDQPSDGIIDVDHVYGFCYAYTRELLQYGGMHDRVLLSRDYSSGNRLETDQCLTARRLGFRVVYDGRIGVRHLAKPRGDMSERSPRWKFNHTRNTLYLFLKHYGIFGKRCLAARFAMLTDVGIVSAIRNPTKANWAYFVNGLCARASAFGHYALYLASGARDKGTRK